MIALKIGTPETIHIKIQLGFTNLVHQEDITKKDYDPPSPYQKKQRDKKRRRRMKSVHYKSLDTLALRYLREIQSISKPLSFDGALLLICSRFSIKIGKAKAILTRIYDRL